MRKILLLRGGALGDFIVTLPAIAALRTHFPAARIELAGNATAAQLARSRGLLDAVHSQHESRWSALYGSAPLGREFAAWLADFDLVLSFWPDPDRDLAARFPLHDAQRFLSAPAMPSRAPAAAHYAAALAPLGIQSPDTFFSLARESTPPFPRHGVTVHPGSGSPRKNWPPQNWFALLPRLSAPVTLLAGEAELPIWENVSAPNVTLLRAPPLEAFVEHLSHTRHYLGHDSGISHLAAACGAPSILLFGPTDPATWAPPAPHVRILHRGPQLSSIPVADVLAALNSP